QTSAVRQAMFQDSLAERSGSVAGPAASAAYHEERKCRSGQTASGCSALRIYDVPYPTLSGEKRTRDADRFDVWCWPNHLLGMAATPTASNVVVKEARKDFCCRPRRRRRVQLDAVPKCAARSIRLVDQQRGVLFLVIAPKLTLKQSQSPGQRSHR